MATASVGVIGAGVMGSCIAQRCALHGYRTVVVDISPSILIASQKRVHGSLRRCVEKNLVSDSQRQSALGRLEFFTKLNRVADCGMVIEAVNEDIDLKKKVISELDSLCGKETVLASNTSSFCIGDLARAAKNPDRVMGIHFMNPATSIDLVELVRSDLTSPKVVDLCKQFAASLGCEIVETRDTPGFVINRILIPMLNEAAYVLEAGVASAEDIDRAMALGARHPIGPLALADRIGLDVILSILTGWHKEFQNERFKPCPIFKEYVRKNRLGRKTGKGFFDYSGDE